MDKSINIIKTSRGGKITWHGPGQLICYLVINLNNRKRDIRKFVNIIENSIIHSLKSLGINSFSDRKNIGIWSKLNNEDKKIADEIRMRFPIDQWRVIKIFSDHQKNFDTTKRQLKTQKAYPLLP